MQKVSVGTDEATWEERVDYAKNYVPTRQHQSNVLAAGCLISVMAILYTTIGFVIGYVIRGL